MEEAAPLFRALAATEPIAHFPDLAKFLTGLGAVLYVGGEHHRGLATTEDAAALYRALATTEPTAYTDDLATCLRNLAVELWREDRWDDGLRAYAEAVAWRGRLARLRADDPDTRTAYRQARGDLAKRVTRQGLDVAAAHTAEAAAARALPPDPRAATSLPEARLDENDNR